MARSPDGVKLVLLGAPLLAAAGSWVGLGTPGLNSLATQLALVAAGGVVVVVFALNRARRETGRVDYFHPLVFPLLYVALSFVLPAWLAFVSGQSVGSLGRAITLSDATPTYMLLAVVAFTAGVFLALRLGTNALRQPAPNLAADRELAPSLRLGGRVVLLAALGLGIWDIANGGAAARGTGQAVYSGLDSLRVALKLLPLTGALLVGVAHKLSQRQGFLPRIDMTLILGVIAVSALTGDRNITISTVLVLMVLLARERVRLVGLVLVVGLLAAFMVAVLHHRNAAVGRTVDKTAFEAIAGDLAPATFSTGAVVAAVPDSFPYLHGDTIVAAVVRQLPGPIAVRLIGPPTDTAAYRFREIIGYQSKNGGVGFSIPAEGYLNFGLPGLMGLTALIGFVVGWSYRRFDPRRCTARALMYPVVVATLPFGLRTDLLGASKAIVYPMLTIAMSLVIAKALRGSVVARSSVQPRRPIPQGTR